uniref:DRBM domain-containing protein n=1 Tax=Macrostomum lignano TaxID=282301 RepID=A0A1I8JEA4_9PLAT
QFQLLEELCARNGLGSPSYQVQSQELLEPSTGAQSSWFLGRVTLSGSHGGAIPPRQFSAFRFTQTTEEARSAAAEAALMQLYQLPAAGGIGGIGGLAFPADPSQAAFLADLRPCNFSGRHIRLGFGSLQLLFYIVYLNAVFGT